MLAPFAGQKQRLLKRLTRHTPAAHSAAAVVGESLTPSFADLSTGDTLLAQTVPDNSGGTINLLHTCLDSTCNTFRPSFVRIDNASHSVIWQQDLTDGPFGGVSEFAVGPDNTVYAAGVFVSGADTNLGTPFHSEIVVLNGETGAVTTVPMPTGSDHFVLLDDDGNVTEDDQIDQGSFVGPLALMPDGTLQTLITTTNLNETDGTRGDGCLGLQCALSISHHVAIKRIRLFPGGGQSTEPIDAYDFDQSDCVPQCIDRGVFNTFIPTGIIPNGKDGAVGTYTKQQTDHTPFQTQMMRHFPGGIQFGDPVNVDLGIFLVPRNGQHIGRALVLSENDLIFMAGDHTISAVDPDSGSVWSFQTAVGEGVSLLAAKDDGGLLATHLMSDIDPDENIASLLLFDTGGGASAAAISGIFDAEYFDRNTLQAIAASGQGELVSVALSIKITTRRIWDVGAGNLPAQRAPAPPQISYDKQIVKTGISLINKDTRGTITATIKPRSVAPNVTFTSTNRARATVVEESRVDGTDSTTVTLRITGIAPTPKEKPNGDAQVQAIFAGNATGARIPLLVIVPTAQEHATGTTTLTNTSFRMTTTPFALVLRTDITNIVTITIRDQFGKALDPLYDGPNVVTETLSNISPANCVSSLEQFVVIPDNVLRTGIKFDETGFLLDFAPNSSITAQQQQDWANQLPVFGHKNSFALAGQGEACTFIQTIKVHGYRVTPDFQRNQVMLPQDQPPIPYTIIDTPRN